MEVQEYLEKHNKRQDKATNSKFKLFFRKLKNFIFPKPSRFTSFLWWCSGADSVLLRISPMKDRVKYAGIGGIVLCTGVLAAFSGRSPHSASLRSQRACLRLLAPGLPQSARWTGPSFP